jgi:polyisoprenoid-binding protein YceI
MTTQRWNIDPSHSSLQFAVRHMVISKVRGQFSRWEGALDLDPASPEGGKVSVKIDAASINTHEPKRDEHLRSADFFDVEKFPEILFASTRVEKLSKNRFQLTGELTLHGVTRTIQLETELLGTGKDPWGNDRVAFSAQTSLSRKEFGLKWNQALETGGVLVGEDIEVSIELEAVRAQATSSQAA